MRFQKSLLFGVVLCIVTNNQIGAEPVFPDTDPFQLRFASQENVAAHREKIAQTMTWHWYARLGLQLGGAALFSYSAYNFLSAWMFSSGDALVESSQKPDKRDSRPITKDDKRAILAALFKLQPPMFTTQWWKNTAIYLCDHLVLKSALGAIVLTAGNTFFGCFFHEDNIAWFVNKNTQIERLSVELRAYAHKFGLRGRREVKMVRDPITGRSAQEVRETPPVQCPQLSVDELHYYRVTLAGICRDLVAQVELIAGFMEYRLDQFQKRGVAPSPDEILQPARLIASVNTFVRSMQSLLPPTKDQPDSVDQIKKPFGTALRFVVDVQELVNRFRGIENSVEWRMINGG